jgi:hypothetical protein
LKANPCPRWLQFIAFFVLSPSNNSVGASVFR